MIFFDLEFYVPPKDRSNKSGELSCNPFKDGHFLLGGVFAKSERYSRRIKDYSFHEFWIWNENNSELEVLKKIHKYFTQEKLLAEKQLPPIKHVKYGRVLLCGIGISRVDIPYLFGRMKVNKIDSETNLFSLLFSSMILDLSEMASVFYAKRRDIYPPTTNQLKTRFKVGKELRLSGKSVWEMYDNGEYKNIEARTKKEIEDMIKLYDQITYWHYKNCKEKTKLKQY